MVRDRARAILSVHHAITVLRQQACKVGAAAAQPLPQPQPPPQPQPLTQPHPQPKPLSDAQARVAAQHAKAKQAQAEYERLQHYFAQLQQNGKVKGPPWQFPAVAPPQGITDGSGQPSTPKWER